MKKLQRGLAVCLALLLAFGCIPQVSAAPEEPLYRLRGYDNAEAFMYDNFYIDDYEWVQEQFEAYYDEAKENPQLVLDFYYDWYYTDTVFESMEAVAEYSGLTIEELYIEYAYYCIYFGEWAYVYPLSLQLNGTKLDFSNAPLQAKDGRVLAPLRALTEAMGGQISYNATDNSVSAVINGKTLSFTLNSAILHVTDENGSRQTVTMDVAAYAENGVTYVPVRFLGQALGYTVLWDEYYNTVVVYDRAALVAQIDSSFTKFNAWMAIDRSTEVSELAKKGVLELLMEYTSLDSINGDETSTVACNMTIIQQGNNFSMSMQVDLYMLFDLFMGYSYYLDDAETENLMELLNDTSIDLIYNDESGMLYLKAPALNQYINEQVSAPVSIASDTWISFELGENMLSDYATMLSVSTDMTMGEYIVQLQEQYYYYWDPSYIYSNVMNTYERYRSVVGDDKLYEVNGNYLCNIDIQDPDYYYWQESYTGSITFNMEHGGLDGKLSYSSIYGGKIDGLFDLTFDLTLESFTLDFYSHSKNASILSMSLTYEESESEEAPLAEPPADSTILPGSLLDSYFYA